MSIEAIRESGYGPRVLRASGDLDVATAPRLLPALARLTAHAPAVLLDLSEVTFLDSSGIRLVDELGRICGHAKIPFHVVAPPGRRPRRVLDVVGMGPPLVLDAVPHPDDVA